MQFYILKVSHFAQSSFESNVTIFYNQIKNAKIYTKIVIYLKNDERAGGSEAQIQICFALLFLAEHLSRIGLR